MLEVREQSFLSWAKLIRICRLSIAHRLLRSLVTVAIISLAIAFLSSILLQGTLGRAALQQVEKDSDHVAAYRNLLSLVKPFGSDEEMIRYLANVSPASVDATNVRNWGTLNDEELPWILAWSDNSSRSFDYIEELPVGRRIQLMSNLSGTAAFDALNEPNKSGPQTGLHPALLEAAKAWPQARGLLARIRVGQEAAAKKIAAMAVPRDVPDYLRSSLRLDPAQTAALFARLSECGFSIAPENQTRIIQGAEYEEKLAGALQILKLPSVRNSYFNSFQEDFDPKRILLFSANSKKKVDWIGNQLALDPEGKNFDPEAFRATAHEFKRRDRLLELQLELAGKFGGNRSATARTYWLIAVSCLVCVVGIANAMLMSVLERFKEIATMKCLGARNETIRFLFMAESLAMGFCGGVVGVIVAGIIAIGPALLMYGEWGQTQFPFLAVLQTLLAGLAFSILIAGIAALYPSHVASRMAPLEAMRVE